MVYVGGNVSYGNLSYNGQSFSITLTQIGGSGSSSGKTGTALPTLPIDPLQNGTAVPGLNGVEYSTDGGKYHIYGTTDDPLGVKGKITGAASTTGSSFKNLLGSVSGVFGDPDQPSATINGKISGGKVDLNANFDTSIGDNKGRFSVGWSNKLGFYQTWVNSGSFMGFTYNSYVTGTGLKGKPIQSGFSSTANNLGVIPGSIEIGGGIQAGKGNKTTTSAAVEYQPSGLNFGSFTVGAIGFGVNPSGAMDSDPANLGQSGGKNLTFGRYFYIRILGKN